jgi:hypothetical protein
LNKGDKATPEEIRLLQQYQEEDFKRNLFTANSSSPAWSGKGSQPRGTMAVKDAKKRASDFWDAFSAESLGPVQNKVLH